MRWTAPEEGSFNSAFDTVLYLRGGCGPEAPELACNDDGCNLGNRSALYFGLAPGESVLLVVDGEAEGNFVLNIQ